MRIAALYDVHGNLPALEAVLAAAALELLASKRCPALEWFSRPLRGEVTAEEATAHFESRRRGA